MGFWSRITRSKSSERDEIKLLVEQHRFALEKALDLAVKKDAYGTITEDKRAEAVQEFLNSVKPEAHRLTEEEEMLTVFKCLGYAPKKRRKLGKGSVSWEFEYKDPALENGFDPKSAPLDGFDFEHWVAKNLRNYGWEADVTQGSGDQGIDVLCKKGGKSVAVQCKRYSGSVGNKAVQEAIAGAQYYGADIPIVISTGSYTKSAKELAKVSNVFLFSEYDLPKIHETLRL